VTIVVKVLINNCQVLLKPNIGPVTAQPAIIKTAMINEAGLPVKLPMVVANLRNRSDFDFLSFFEAIYLI